MKYLIVVALALLLPVVGSQTFPYVSFLGQTLANHSYVDLSLVGDDGSGSDSVQCHTDLTTCCSGTEGKHRGDWYFPNGTRLPFTGNNYFFEGRTTQRVDLRGSGTSSPSGIYRCDISTTDFNTSVKDTVYVGLYHTNEGSFKGCYISHTKWLKLIEKGEITVQPAEKLTVDSGLNENNLQFTLTCISTGGPATTVTWSKDSETFGGVSESMLDNATTAQYTHTFTVTGRLEGVYTCSVANKISNDSAQLNVTGKMKHE